MSAPTIVFDLDGTLVDTAPDLVDTLNVILAREGLPAVPFGAARNMIGGGARVLIERGLKADGRAWHAAEVQRLYDDFVAHYGEHLADRSAPFPGAVEAIEELSGQGCRFAVCTNKLEKLAVRLLDALKLLPHFSAICGQDTFGVQKPDPEMLLATIRRAGGTPGNAVMVGDSHNDIATARRAGVPVIGVEFGYTETPIAEFGPDLVIGHFAKLPAAVSRIFSLAD
ncbi:MAG TPA: phosphoglycolate phosphatase [Xanthobacteraceae bacterium]|nr:phosphoglycolate phosphatase [Xanthobacteraceae bacterium]